MGAPVSSGVRSTRIPKTYQLPATTGPRPNKGWRKQEDCKRASVANWWHGLALSGQRLRPASDGNSTHFGDPLASLLVIYLVSVGNWPQPKPEEKGPLDNPRVWLRKALKETEGVDWCDDVLRAEWSPNGDFLLRFGTEPSGELALPRLLKLDNLGTPLSPRWATCADLRGSLSDDVPETIQESFARLRKGGLGTTTRTHRPSMTATACGSSTKSCSTAPLASTGVGQLLQSRPMQSRCRGAMPTRVGSLSTSSRCGTACDSTGKWLGPVLPGSAPTGYRAVGADGSRADVWAPPLTKRVRVSTSSQIVFIDVDPPLRSRAEILSPKAGAIPMQGGSVAVSGCSLGTRSGTRAAD